MLRFRFIYVIVHIIRFFMLVRTEFVGRENIPEEGPFIVVTNHMSVVDAPLVFLCAPLRPWRLFAGERWEQVFFFGAMLKMGGAIFINRGEVDRKALKAGIDALENGAVFGLAPEGTRSKIGQLNRARDGAAYLANRAKVPIVPISLINTDQWAGNIKRLRRTTVTAVIGEPFLLPDLGRRARSRDLAAYTHLIMVKIASKLPERYHGYYADSPALAALQAGHDPWPACLAAEEIEL